MLYKMTEWEDHSGWHCNCIDNLGNNSGVWYLPARILNLSPADYLQLLIDKFQPDRIIVDKEKCNVFFSWSRQDKMRIYKNYINKMARQKNFQI